MNVSLKNTLALGLITVVLGGDLFAQRGRRGGRRSRPEPTSTTPPPAPKVDDTEIKNHVAITGATVYVGTGQIIHRATVLIGDSKILKVLTIWHVLAHSSEEFVSSEIESAQCCQKCAVRLVKALREHSVGRCSFAGRQALRCVTHCIPRFLKH